MPRFHPIATLHRLRSVERKLLEGKKALDDFWTSNTHNEEVLNEASQDLHWALIFLSHAQTHLLRWEHAKTEYYRRMTERHSKTQVKKRKLSPRTPKR